MTRRIALEELWSEPFRLFFPAAMMAGIAGAALWPLHFLHLLEYYPGTSHARLMAHGFFGGFIFGFLGTSLPRLLGAPGFSAAESVVGLLGFIAMTLAHLAGRTHSGDVCFLLTCLWFGVAGLRRLARRTDVPPPGFVLVLLAFGCAGTGVLIELFAGDDAFHLLLLKPLLLYQGFVLLPMLGVGTFILPRFFGIAGEEFPTSRTPPPGWTGRMVEAAAAGLLLILSFNLEAAGHPTAGNLLRATTAAAYLLRQLPLHRLDTRLSSAASAIKGAFFLLLLGLVATVFVPGFRVAVLHVSLIGGFSVVTLCVGARVILGHGGALHRLQGRQRWITWSVVLMVVGMATRISGDFSPKIMPTHYSYGALLWIAAVLIWASRILPSIHTSDEPAPRQTPDTATHTP